jgi:hypothetical protein
MADMAYDALIELAQTVMEACVANNIKGMDLEPLDTIGVSMTGIGGVGADEELYKVDESLQSKEHLNAQVAMAGVFLTILLDLISGQP